MRLSWIAATLTILLLPLGVRISMAQSLSQTFLIHGEPSEVAGAANGSIVTPATGPAGTLINTGGSVNFAPATVGNGVYFLNCCALTGNAYYKFTGTQLGSIFNVGSGEITFYLKSRQSWTQRKATTSYRGDFDVEDTIGHKLFRVLIDNNSGTGTALRLCYTVDGATQNYYFPAGQEDVLFGNGVTLAIRLTWDGANVRLYTNGSLVKTTSYTMAPASWSASSVFILGADNYQTSGASNASDDIIDEFTVLAPSPGSDTSAPTIPTGLSATAVSTSQINLSWTASTDNVAVTGYTVYRSGTFLATTANTSYSDLNLTPGTMYTYAVAAFDAAGNSSAQSTPASATTLASDTIPPSTPSGLSATAKSTIQINLSWLASTDNIGVAGYTIFRNGSQINKTANTSYSDSSLVANTTYTYTVSAYDTAGNNSPQSSPASATTFAPGPNNWSVGWNDLSGTILQNVCPPNYVDPSNSANNYAFSSYCHNVIDSWSGGIADTTNNRMIIWGGGHVNYSGNELYSLNLAGTPPTLTRITDPSIPVVQTTSPTCPATTPDGKPNSRETYNNLVFIPTQGQMFSFGGSVACGNGYTLRDTWLLNLSALQWQRMDPVNGTAVPPNFSGNTYSFADYDPNTDSIFFDWTDSFWQYNYRTNTYSLLVSNHGSHVPYGAGSVIDPKRKLFIFMGHEYQDFTTPHVYAISIAPGSTYRSQDWSSQVTGCDVLARAAYPGMAYDPVLDRIVGYPNVGNTVYLFNPDTKTCVTQSFPNGPQNPPPVCDCGVFGRFRYFPSLDVFALVTESYMDAFILKLPPPGPDTTPPSTPSGLVASAVSASQINLSWAASVDNVAVAGYTVFRNSAQVATTTSTSYSNTGLAGNTTYTYTVSAYDSAGNQSPQSNPAQATTLTPDTTAPMVSITAPASGATVSNSITVTATASDNVAVATVQFQLDGVNLGPQLKSGPYSITWDTTTSTNSAHTITAVATDTSQNVTTSAPVNVTVNNVVLAKFVLHGQSTEFSGTSNGSAVTPALGPSGTVVNTGGTVNFVAGGVGVYFLNCCALTNNAYVKFQGTQLANLFSVSGGEIDLTIASRQSWAQRRLDASYRGYYSVEDVIGNKVFRLFIDNNAGTSIRIAYVVDGVLQNYYVPSGQEDTLFGNGITLTVRVAWDGTKFRLYLNGNLVQTTAYALVTPSWSASSLFVFGGDDYKTNGASNSSDDIMSEFVVK